MRLSILTFVVTLLFSPIFISCKKENIRNVTLIRDCTGTYLRWEGKDYLVCNLERVSDFPSGSTLSASFIRIKECNGPANSSITCYMYHPNEGWIEVTKIK